MCKCKCKDMIMKQLFISDHSHSRHCCARSELGADVELLHRLAAAQALPAAARLDAVPRQLLLLPGAQQAAAAGAGDQGYSTGGGFRGLSPLHF